MTNPLARIVKTAPPETVDVQSEPARSLEVRIEFPDLPGGPKDYDHRFREVVISSGADTRISGKLDVEELTLANDIAKLLRAFLRKKGHRK